MNKTALKNFAIAARLELLQRVMNRANLYGVNEETCKAGSIAPSSGFQKLGGELLTREEENQRDALIRRVNQQGYRQTMEEAAYTWFNRFIALRYMQEHQLLPVSQRVLPEMPGQMPEIIREAHQLSLDGVDSALVLDLLDRNETTALYRYLLISLCNVLHDPLPLMFEKISDYTELLFPDGLLKDDSVLAALARIPAEDFQDIQVIGWLYQYYNTDLKNETFELLKKNVKITKERIGAATQLFTPEWIVRYMVQNSLGRLWLEGHPEESLRMKWRYYMDEAQQEPEVAAKLADIRQGYASMQLEDIKLLDPCMGSGHILVYAFDMLMEVYRTMGYTDRDAVRSIVENNLYGLDIDDRAAQLAYFAVMMKACEYDRRFLRRGIQPHVCAMQESNGMPENAWDCFAAQKNTAQTLYRAFEHAKDFGSLIAPDVTLDDLLQLENKMEEMARHAECVDLVTQATIASALAAVQPLMEQARILVNKYDVVVTNPPYMGGGTMGPVLDSYVKNYYPDSKADLYAVFMERCDVFCTSLGFKAMITQNSWMFLSTYENLRKQLLRFSRIINMAHLGPRAFDEISGEVVQTTAFVSCKANVPGYVGSYKRLVDYMNEADKEKGYLSSTNLYFADQSRFLKIPCHPIAYWASESYYRIYEECCTVIDIATPKQGFATTDNERFLRMWYEVDRSTMTTSILSVNADTEEYVWVPYNKGGPFVKWYGNMDYVCNWKNRGHDLRSHKKAVLRNMEYQFRKCITWSLNNFGSFGARERPNGSLFDTNGMSLFAESSDHNYLLAFLSSKLASYFMKICNPTMSSQVGDIARLPVFAHTDKKDDVSALSEQCKDQSMEAWDSLETSWDFKKHPLI